MRRVALIALAALALGVVAPTWGQTCSGHQEVHSTRGSIQTGPPPAASQAWTCTWLIQVPLNGTIRASFEQFPLGIGANSYLRIYDGSTPDAALLVAENEELLLPANLFSSGNQLYVAYHRDANAVGPEMELAFETIPPGNPALMCAASQTVAVTDDAPVTLSDGSDDAMPYHNLQNCTWHLEAPAGEQVVLSWEWLEVQDTPGCTADSVSVYDGPTVHSPLLMSLCGYDASMGLASSGQQLTVAFTSNEVVVAQGWQAEATSEPSRIMCHGSSSVTASDTFQTIEDGSKELVAYANNMDCAWQLQAAAGERVSLSFSTLQLQRTDGCANDYITVYDGADASAPVLLPRTCWKGENDIILFSSARLMYVVFHSDASVVDDGFRGNFVGANWCSGASALTTAGLVRASTLDDGGAPAGLDCTWQLSGEAGETVQLWVDWYGLTDGTCASGRLMVHDGASAAAPVLLDTCDRRSASVLYSQQQSLFVSLRTFQPFSSDGFQATFRANRWCNGVHTLVGSGRFDDGIGGQEGALGAELDCQWRMSAPAGQVVRLALSGVVFAVEQEQAGCEDEYLAIYDGASSAAPLLLRACARGELPALLSSAGALTVRFVTADAQRSRGFTADYAPAPVRSLCSGTATISGQARALNITAGNAEGDAYANNMACRWRIVAPVGHKVQIHLHTLALPDHRPCTDYVWLVDGAGTPTAAQQQQSQHCGRAAVPTFTSSDTTAWLGFVSDGSVVDRGFVATVTFLDTRRTCCRHGRALRAASDRAARRPLRSQALWQCGVGGADHYPCVCRDCAEQRAVGDREGPEEAAASPRRCAADEPGVIVTSHNVSNFSACRMIRSNARGGASTRISASARASRRVRGFADHWATAAAAAAAAAAQPRGARHCLRHHCCCCCCQAQPRHPPTPLLLPLALLPPPPPQRPPSPSRHPLRPPCAHTHGPAARSRRRKSRP